MKKSSQKTRDRISQNDPLVSLIAGINHEIRPTKGYTRHYSGKKAETVEQYAGYEVCMLPRRAAYSDSIKGISL